MKTITQKSIYKNIKNNLVKEFEGWWDMNDAKDVCHGYIIKSLSEYDLDEKQALQIESKLINFCIKLGVK